jgi:hypothetical protein
MHFTFHVQLSSLLILFDAIILITFLKQLGLLTSSLHIFLHHSLTSLIVFQVSPQHTVLCLGTCFGVNIVQHKNETYASIGNKRMLLIVEDLDEDEMNM